MELRWTPQEAYLDFFETDPSKIIANRSVFKEGYRYYVPYGGRGSGKTWSFADAAVIDGTLRPVRILVTRELQNSIEDSIKSEIENVIADRGLSRFYRSTKTSIIGANGTKIMFKGLKNNIKSIKSIADVDIVLAEESEDITKDSWDIFLPSIRPRSGKAPIVAVIFNPGDELDDTWQRFIVNPPPGTVSKLINWRDNIFFPPHLEEQRRHCLETRPKKDYDNIWEGKPKGDYDDCIIDRAWIRAARFASKLPGFQKIGDTVTSYDPAGQGKDYNSVCTAEGNIVKHIEEWLKSDDLRKATRVAMSTAQNFSADTFRYDECGGFGDGVSVFVDDIVNGVDAELEAFEIDVSPFNAGDPVIDPDELIHGTELTNSETYTNAKAQAHGVTAQRLYNTYRFVKLGEEVSPDDMISIDIEDDMVFNKLVKELSAPLWVKSSVNSKKKVESKKDMEKRTGQVSPNLADAFIMCFAPTERQTGFFDVFINKKIASRKA